MTAPLIDPFARAITYLRLSVTDRCDFRCVYCMSENMTFLPKKDLLSLEELDRPLHEFYRAGCAQIAHHGRRTFGPARYYVVFPIHVAPSAKRCFG
jgi:MoaA/NifB/PqqE/SkfB family radical SAM enzyme